MWEVGWSIDKILFKITLRLFSIKYIYMSDRHNVFQTLTAPSIFSNVPVPLANESFSIPLQNLSPSIKF